MWNTQAVDFSVLSGKTLTSVAVDKLENKILFATSDGFVYKMFHDQDCCEHVYIEDIVGDFNDLLHEPILLAEGVSNRDLPAVEPEYDDSYTWTFYKLATNRGYVTLRWYGTSNGYYSESVDFIILQEPAKKEPAVLDKTEYVLVRITSKVHPEWSATILFEPSITDEDALQFYGSKLRREWFSDLGMDADEIEDKVIAPGSFFVKGRVPFHAEDAYTLGLKVGDEL